MVADALAVRYNRSLQVMFPGFLVSVLSWFARMTSHRALPGQCRLSFPDGWLRGVALGWMVGVWLLAPSSISAQEFEAREEAALRQAAAIVAPSLVKIETVGGLDRVQEVLLGTGPTTGVVVGADGYIISSAFNFLSRPATILVTLADGRRLPATRVATDHLRMLTLLKVDKLLG